MKSLHNYSIGVDIPMSVRWLMEPLCMFGTKPLTYPEFLEEVLKYFPFNKPSTMKKDRLTIDNNTYDLVHVHTPTFMIQDKLPLVIIKEHKNGVYTYESVRIGNHYFAMVPFTPKDFNEALLKQKGWNFQEVFGQSNIYHKGFDGNSWFTLMFEGDGYITITRVRKEGQEKLVKFQGGIYTEQEFDTICKLLNID